MIEIKGVSKHFGPLRAVNDITFRVEPGEVLGFLGPNGAGKSTTMKMITGFLATTRGSIVVCGHDVAREPRYAKQAIGYLPEGAPLYPDMTPGSFLRFVAEARGMRRAESRARIADVVEKVALHGVMRQRIETLSKGYKRRLGLACALLHDPPVLILDEPTDGLDPNQKHEVRRLIKSMAQGKVIVLSTHILEEVEAVCTRAIIISEGRLCFDGSPDDLRRRSPLFNSVEVHLSRIEGSNLKAELSGLAGVRRVEELGVQDGLARLRVLPESGANVTKSVADLARERNWEVEHLHVDHGNLDEVFREITAGETAAESAGEEVSA